MSIIINFLKTLFLSLIAFCLVGGCSELHRERPFSLLSPSLLSPNTGPMRSCRSGFTYKKVVRVFFETLDLLNATRDVEHSEPVTSKTESDEEAADHPSGNTDDYTGSDDLNKNGPYNVDFNKITGIARGDYIMIRIIINHPDQYTFYDEKDIPAAGGVPIQYGIHGVGWGDKSNIFNMCGASVFPPPQYRSKVAVFFVPVADPSVTTKFATYNFGIYAGTITTTPVFIDPHAHQPG